MRSLIRRFSMWLRGERRHMPRPDAERVRATDQVANAEIRLARKLGVTPDELFDGDKRRSRLLDELHSHR